MIGSAKRFLSRSIGKSTRILLGLALTALAVAHTLGYVHTDIITRLDNLFYDLRLRTDVLTQKKDPRIVIVDIDEKSLAEVGRWPWSRDVIATLVKKLVDEYQVSVVGFDVVFAEPEKTDASLALDLLKKNSPELSSAIARSAPKVINQLDRDTQLAQVLKDRPVVLGYYFNHQTNNVSGSLPAPLFTEKDLEGYALQGLNWEGYGANLPQLQQVAAGGFFNPFVDNDGVVRSVPVLAKFNGGYYQSFAMAVYRKALNDPQLLPIFPEGVGKDYGALEGIMLKSNEVEVAFPVERQMILLAQFRGKGGPAGGGFPYVSASDVLSGKVKAQDLAGRIVLVGTTAPGLMDLRSTPVNPVYPGVEVHANVVSSMLDGKFKIRPEYAAGVLVLFLVIAGVTMSLLMAMLNATWSLIVAVVMLVLTVVLNGVSYYQQDTLYPLATIFLLVLTIFIFNIAAGYLSEANSKRAMVNLFGEYVAPELVTEMAKNPGSYSMEGDSRDLTVLFSDVRGFTTISESLEPNELREYINQYLTTMSEIIRNNRGTLDKYIGDAIMAFWGAPIADADHATHAVNAAREMQEAAITLNEKFRQRNWPHLAIGIGVNTGNMRVGDMGSKIRRAYTVMGDAVNLASRLEGITKTYGVGLVVGLGTKNMATDYAYRELDKVRVKGKNEPVPIFEPLGLSKDLSADVMGELQQWHDALALFRAQRWDEADALFLKLESFSPSTKLYSLYRERVDYFKANPPGEQWDGVTTFDTK